MLLTCILYCDAGPGYLIRTVCKYSLLFTNIYLSSYVFLRRRRSLTSRKLYVCLQTFLHACFLHPMIWSSLCRHCKKNVAVFAQLCWLFCELNIMPLICRISSGLSSGQTFFRSSMWISSVAGYSKILWTNLWHATVAHFTRWHLTGR